MAENSLDFDEIEQEFIDEDVQPSLAVDFDENLEEEKAPSRSADPLKRPTTAFAIFIQEVRH